MSLQLGSNGPLVTRWQQLMVERFHSYAVAANGGPLKADGYYGNDDAAVQREYESRTHQPEDGIVSDHDLAALGLADPVLPIAFSIEGHQSNMFFGPAADTCTQLEGEGVCHHKPIGYNNGAIPFDNASGINELAHQVASRQIEGPPVDVNNPDGPKVMWPFPAGTPWAYVDYSQGAIVGSYFYFDFLAPGKPLNWRLRDLRGVLTYGNPCRQTDSIAPWATSWIKKTGTHGLDPIRRFGLPGYPAKPGNWMDVYREGDIFAENTDDKAGEAKAAVYEAVMGKVIGNPFTLAAQIADVFKRPFAEVLGIVKAIMSGIGFLADNPNPHYSAFDLTGGRDWMRSVLR